MSRRSSAEMRMHAGPACFCSWRMVWRRPVRLGRTSWMLRAGAGVSTADPSAGAALLPECHSAKRTEADIDLAAFTSLADVRKHPQVWQKVGEMLDSGQMPPKDADQPTDAERASLQQWVRGLSRRSRRKLGPAIRGGSSCAG